MVINNHLYEEQTRRLLAETQSELTAIGNQMAELQQRWNTLKKETEAYEVALQGFLFIIGHGFYSLYSFIRHHIKH